MKTSPRVSGLFRQQSTFASLGAAFCLAISLVSQLEGAASAPGLLGHWRFEQGQGDMLEDSSGNRNTGELLGADWAQGEFGTALYITGKDSCAIVPQLNGLDGSNELTVEAWVLWEAGGRYVDEVRALPAIAGVRNPVLTIGGKRLAFPAELSTGDRLVFDGGKCRLHRRTAAELEWIAPQGGPFTLEPGRTRVVLSFGSDLLPQFRVGASLVKHY